MTLDPEILIAIRLMGSTAGDPPTGWKVTLLHPREAERFEQTETEVLIQARDAWTAHEEAARLYPDHAVEFVIKENA